MIKWQEIDEDSAKEMLQQVFENLDNDELMDEYFEALEKQYRKPSGTISDFIFYNDLSINEITEKLKVNTLIYL
ncbi:MAG: hypothetical protein AB8B69_26780 [Chitinophagales bacterium]